MNKFKHALLLTALLTATAIPGMAQSSQLTQKRASPHDAVYARISRKLVTIYYGRPYTKDRKIWGTLVPWDKAWRLGADEATTLVLQNAISIGGTTVPAGAYTLYMVPSESGTSKLAISKSIGAWGIPVDQKHDVTRVDLKKEDLDAPVDQLTISVGPADGGGVIKIQWEKTQYSVDFSNATAPAMTP